MRDVTDQGSLREWVVRMIKETEEWEEYENLLLGLPAHLRRSAQAAEEIMRN